MIIMEGHHPMLSVLAIVLLYWFVSISMVFTNKHILGGSFSSDDLSIFVAWYQSMSAVAFIQVWGTLSGKIWSKFKVPVVDFQILLHSDMLKLSLSFVFSLTLNNLMLKHIGVAFYQVARSFTLIFTITLSVSVLKHRLTCQGVVACLLVMCGFVIGIDQENDSGTLSVWGIIYGLLASLSSAFCGVHFKRVEGMLDNDSLKQTYFNNINSFIMFLPLVFSTGQASEVLSSIMASSLRFWVFLTISGLMSLLIGWVSALQIRYTSPITHHISINAKSVAQTIIAILYYNEQKSALWWLGNLLVVLGLLLYAFSKLNKTSSKPSEIPLPNKYDKEVLNK